MYNIGLRQLQERDIIFASEMVRTEQWSVTEEDLRRMQDYEPNGCFVAEVNGNLAGHVFSINYGKLGWIGLLIVKPKYRNIGIGKLLMEKAKQYLLSLGASTIKLEAVPKILDLYRNMGFVDEYASLRFRGAFNNSLLEKTQAVTLIKKEMIPDLAEFDAEYFGANRIKVLSRLYEANPKLCLAAHSKSEIYGYVMCRKAENGYNLGPWVCTPENTHAAVDLLMNCLKRICPEIPVHVGVPALNERAIEILTRFGFMEISKAIRMRFGEELEECIKGIFAIAGAMKG